MSQLKLTERSRTRVTLEPSVSGNREKTDMISGVGQSPMKQRRKSYGFGTVPGVGAQRKRSSQAGLEFKRPPLMYLNTYQLGPYVKFHEPTVLKAINYVLDLNYIDFRYNSTDAPTKAMLIADQVMRAVKEMNFNRYRIISVVTVAQKRAQCYNNAVTFLWDHEFDSYVDVQRDNSNSFIQVTCFGVYLD